MEIEQIKQFVERYKDVITYKTETPEKAVKALQRGENNQDLVLSVVFGFDAQQDNFFEQVGKHVKEKKPAKFW